jgi:hypothetical protein
MKIRQSVVMLKRSLSSLTSIILILGRTGVIILADGAMDGNTAKLFTEKPMGKSRAGSGSMENA